MHQVQSYVYALDFHLHARTCHFLGHLAWIFGSCRHKCSESSTTFSLIHLRVKVRYGEPIFFQRILLTFRFSKDVFVLSWLPSLYVRGFIDSQYSWGVSIIICFIKCFKYISFLLYEEFNTLFYLIFFILVKYFYFNLWIWLSV